MEQWWPLKKRSVLSFLRLCHVPSCSVMVSGLTSCFWKPSQNMHCCKVSPSAVRAQNIPKIIKNGRISVFSEAPSEFLLLQLFYFDFFSLAKVCLLAFRVNIWFPMKETKEVPATWKYVQQGLKILPWKFTCSNTVCFSSTFLWLWC